MHAAVSRFGVRGPLRSAHPLHAPAGVDTRRIGSLEVTVVGLGCNNFGGRVDLEGTRRVVDAALDAGINFLDTADIYGATRSEEFLGTVLEGRRDRVIVATKFGMKIDDARSGAKPDYVRRACEDSLRRLRTDRIDLYQLHQPDPTTPIEQTLAALDGLVRAGKVREIGCSNFSAGDIEAAQEASRAARTAGFVSVQNEYSLLHREPEGGVLEECRRRGLAFIPFFPLASGLLTGKYTEGGPPPKGARLSEAPKDDRFANDENRRRARELGELARSRGRTLLELAFSWLLSQTGVASVIAGATKPEQVRANAAAAGWRLTDEDLREIDRIAPISRRPTPVA